MRDDETDAAVSPRIGPSWRADEDVRAHNRIMGALNGVSGEGRLVRRQANGSRSLPSVDLE